VTLTRPSRRLDESHQNSNTRVPRRSTTNDFHLQQVQLTAAPPASPTNGRSAGKSNLRPLRRQVQLMSPTPSTGPSRHRCNWSPPGRDSPGGAPPPPARRARRLGGPQAAGGRCLSACPEAKSLSESFCLVLSKFVLASVTCLLCYTCFLSHYPSVRLPHPPTPPPSPSPSPPPSLPPSLPRTSILLHFCM
jgi:hypothetical protein